jgi:hypothetical protein
MWWAANLRTVLLVLREPREEDGMQHEMMFLAEQRRKALLDDAERERRVRRARHTTSRRWLRRNP